MKLKYYLKGLGTGILFASIILSISFAVYDRQNDKKTQDDIIAAALEAGMVWPEETSSNDTTTPTESTSEPTTTDNRTSEATTPEETTPEATTPEETTPEETTPEETTPEETTPEETTPEETTSKEAETTIAKDLDACVLYKGNDKSRIQILKGMNSYDVAKILEKADVLKGYVDREAFNDYLVAKGYGGYIMVGVFEIPAGATYDEIISIVCKK